MGNNKIIGAKIKSIRESKPVSYTPLDVYKRQLVTLLKTGKDSKNWYLLPTCRIKTLY